MGGGATTEVGSAGCFDRLSNVGWMVSSDIDGGTGSLITSAITGAAVGPMSGIGPGELFCTNNVFTE